MLWTTCIDCPSMYTRRLLQCSTKINSSGGGTRWNKRLFSVQPWRWHTEADEQAQSLPFRVRKHFFRDLVSTEVDGEAQSVPLPIREKLASQLPSDADRAGRAKHDFQVTQAVLRKLANTYPIAMRDACQCTACVDPSSGQRDFSFADIPERIAMRSVEHDATRDEWLITWASNIPGNDSHVSRYSQRTVQELIFGHAPSLESRRQITLWNAQTFEKNTVNFKYARLLQRPEILAQALHLLSRDGLIFISNMPRDETAVTKLVTRLTGLYRNTFYGETWDVRSVPEAKNVAYTSKVLDFHMDLLYMKEPPGLQVLHCLENSCTGGESEFVDTYKAIDLLHDWKPEYTKFLIEKSSIRYGYDTDGHFYSDDKPVIKLRPQQDGAKRDTQSAQFENALHPDFLQEVECVYWSPPFVKQMNSTHLILDKSFHDRRQFLRDLLKATKAFASVLRRPELVYETKLPAGTCAVFDNLRVVHARKAFDVNSGKRWLKGAYGDRQDLMSLMKRHATTSHRSHKQVSNGGGRRKKFAH